MSAWEWGVEGGEKERKEYTLTNECMHEWRNAWPRVATKDKGLMVVHMPRYSTDTAPLEGSVMLPLLLLIVMGCEEPSQLPRGVATMVVVFTSPAPAELPHTVCITPGGDACVQVNPRSSTSIVQQLLCDCQKVVSI